MAGGYRCSLGHTWNSAAGDAETVCPVCGDTTLVVIGADEKPAVFVLATGGDRAGGQDETQAIPASPRRSPDPADHAATREFTAPVSAKGSDAPDPSIPSLAAMPPESGRTAGAADSSIVPFGPDGVDPDERVNFAPPLVPGYEILHEVGRGGMGVVYKARQVSLNRLVALKMILSGSHAGPSERGRFRREAESVAALQHPHIVQIFDIGEADGHPYLALEFVEGGSLAQRLTGAPWNATPAAELVEVLARTTQFAHDAGIIHRDLKPGNILIGNDEGGKMKEEREADSGSSFLLPPSSLLRPKVTDFGLAKRLDESHGRDGGTRTGAVLGTPSYIAPEQAGGKTRDIGPATDVYALGAILYELLTGRPPFRGETPLDTVLQVLHDDPVPPKRLHPLAPRDLETICLKCLSKQPAKRYSSAAALADDLRRFLKGEPILARPLSAWGRGVKWARRHPALAVLLCVTAVAAVSLVTVLSVAYVRVRDAVEDRRHEAWVAQQERLRAEAEKRRAEELAAEIEKRRVEAVQKAQELEREKERFKRAAYARELSQVAILCDRDPLRATALLEDEGRCPKDLRDFTWHYLRRLCQREDRAYLDHQPDDPLRSVAYSPDSMFVATAGDAGLIRVWDPRTGRTWAVLAGHAGAVHQVAFSPDGAALASAGADGSVRLWLLPPEVLAGARRSLHPLPWLPPVAARPVDAHVLAAAVTLADAHAGEATCVAFSPDGRELVSGGTGGNLCWWNLTGWRPAPTDVAGLGGLGAAAAAAARAKGAPDARPVWAPGKPVPAHEGGVLCLAFAENGKLLASGGADRLARVWAADGSKLIRTLPSRGEHADAVRAIAVSPDGSTVATANNVATASSGQQPSVRLFDTQTWQERRLFGHTKSIYALAFSDDGTLLASAGFDHAVRLWDAEDGRERGRLVGHSQQVNALAFAPDRKTIVSAGMDGVAIVWQTAARANEPADLLQNPRDFPSRAPAQGLTAVGIGGAGEAFVTGDDLGRVRMFAADFVPPGGAAPAGVPGPLSLTPLLYATPQLKEPARAAAASLDGRSFVVATDQGLLVWQPPPLAWRGAQPNYGRGATFNRHAFVRTPSPVHAAAFDPSGRWIATADADAVRVYDTRDLPRPGEEPSGARRGRVVLAVGGARELAFHPRREWLAVSAGPGFSVVTLAGKVLASAPAAHVAPTGGGDVKPNVEVLAFDKSGARLATADASGLVKLWSLDENGGLTFGGDLTGHTGPVFALAFNPDGRTLASGGDDRVVILWDPVARQERLTLAGHADRVLDLAFNANGTSLVSASRDGAVKRWRADPRPASESGPRLPLPLPGT